MKENNEKVINFDLDGTLVDLYGVANWLEYLLAEDATPYAIAEPLINMQIFARLLNKLQKNGYIINIISWTSKNGSNVYNSLVTDVKKAWLKKYLKSVRFNNIFIVPYGTPKNALAKGILFDDEERNRIVWGENAYDVDNILGVLKRLYK